MKDVAIVGGGPSGCFMGEKLAKKGFETTIIEEHSEVGQPMCCAGILGAQRLLKETGLDPKNWSVNKLKGGIFSPPSGNSVKLTRDQTEAYAIDRAKFDRSLAERAVRAGAELRLNTRCTEVSPQENKVSLKTETQNGKEQLESRLVIGADGTNSLVARNCDLMKEFSPTICAQAEIVKETEDFDAKVYVGNELSQDFFAWKVPAGDVYRVGLGDKEGNVKEKLHKFMKNTSDFSQNTQNKMVRLTTDLIPTPNTRKIYGNRVLLIGDAAGQVKPLTGGGLYLGLSCAQIASQVAAEALEKEPSEKNLQKYEASVNEKFSREFKLGARARKILKKMTDEDLSEFIELLEKPKIRNLILENADFDRHSNLFKTLIKKGPSLIKSVGARKLTKYLSWLMNS